MMNLRELLKIMNEIEFLEFIANFKAFAHEEDLSRIFFLRIILSKAVKMDDEQFNIFIHTLMQIEDEKRPSNTEEFNRIMKKGFEK